MLSRFSPLDNINWAQHWMSISVRLYFSFTVKPCCVDSVQSGALFSECHSSTNQHLLDWLDILTFNCFTNNLQPITNKKTPGINKPNIIKYLQNLFFKLNIFDCYSYFIFIFQEQKFHINNYRVKTRMRNSAHDFRSQSAEVIGVLSSVRLDRVRFGDWAPPATGLTVQVKSRGWS